MTSLFSINSPLWHFMDKALHLVWLNLLWFVCCIPVITIGASTTALYAVTLKYAKNQEGYLTRSFFQAFKKNFVPSTLIWALMAITGIVLGLDLIVYLRASELTASGLLFMAVFFTGILIYIFISLYVYALIAAFQNTPRLYLKNALILSICHWPASILMIFSGLMLFLAGMLLFPPLLFAGFAVFCYFSSKYFNRIFERLV